MQVEKVSSSFFAVIRFECRPPDPLALATLAVAVQAAWLPLSAALKWTALRAMAERQPRGAASQAPAERLSTHSPPLPSLVSPLGGAVLPKSLCSLRGPRRRKHLTGSLASRAIVSVSVLRSSVSTPLGSSENHSGHSRSSFLSGIMTLDSKRGVSAKPLALRYSE